MDLQEHFGSTKDPVWFLQHLYFHGRLLRTLKYCWWCLSFPKDWKSLDEWALGPFSLGMPVLEDLVYIYAGNCCSLLSSHRHSPVPCLSWVGSLISGLQQQVCWLAQGVCITSALQALVAFGWLRKPLDCTPSWGCCLWGAMPGRRGALSPWAVWDPGTAVPASSVANGAPVFHLSQQSKAGVTSVFSRHLTSLIQPLWREARPQQGKLLWCIYTVLHTSRVGSLVTEVCHLVSLCHHPRCPGISLPSALTCLSLL